MQQDPLSSILSLIEARAVYAGGFSAGGRWAIRFPPPDKIKFFAIAEGNCLVTVDGLPRPFQLAVGDVLLLSAPVAFTVASEEGVAPADASEVFAGGNRMVGVGEGNDFRLLGGHIDLGSASSRLLIDNLPPVIHLRSDEAGAGQLQWLVRELVQECITATPGADAASMGLAHLIFLQILRGYLSRERGADIGWLRAACDPKLAPALSLMHGDPTRNWHLPELARAAAMSRTAFATHFKAVAGIAPLSYLAEWRMRLAERKLQDGGQSVASVAESVGYASEAAFSTAFKRIMGRSPRQGAGKGRRTVTEQSLPVLSTL